MHKSIKEQVLEAIDIVDVIGERVSLKRKGREYVGLCPFHDDHRPSMAVSPQKQIFKCWSCGVGGDVFKFVQLSQRVEFAEALRMLAERAGISTRDAERQANQPSREPIRQALQWACTHFQRNLQQTPAGKAALDYARRRGMTDETIARFGLGLAADAWDDLLQQANRARVPRQALQQAGLIASNDQGRTYDRFRNRLIFPINDALGRVVAFGGRTLGDDPAKYLNSPETPLFNKSRILYGLDVARQDIGRERQAIIVEGYTDAVLLSQAGVRNVVATLGTALTDSHVKLLRPLADVLLMCFDSDEAGMRAADRAVETALRHRITVKVVIMPDGQDPADFVIGQGSDALKSLLQSAIDALEFHWNRTVAAFSHAGDQGRRDALERFLQFVARVSQAGGIDPLDQGLLVGRLAEMLALPGSTVYELLARAKASAARESSSYTPDTSEITSAYDASIRNLPPGLVAAAEELFGLTLSNPSWFGEARSALGAAARRCQTWSFLFETMATVEAERGELAKAEVLARCEDSVSCETVSRACQRSASAEGTAELCTALIHRIEAELGMLERQTLRSSLRRNENDERTREQAFGSLLDAARSRHSVLGAGQRGDRSR